MLMKELPITTRRFPSWAAKSTSINDIQVWQNHRLTGVNLLGISEPAEGIHIVQIGTLDGKSSRSSSWCQDELLIWQSVLSVIKYHNLFL